MDLHGAWVTLPLNCKIGNVHMHNKSGGGGMEIEQLLSELCMLRSLNAMGLAI